MKFNYLPIRRVYHGNNSTIDLPGLITELGARRILIISSNSVSKTTFYGDMKRDLPVEYSEFREITQHSPMEEIEHATEMMRNHNCDTIISVGGGSVQDAAKLVRYYFDMSAVQIAIPTTLSAAEFSHIAGYSIGGEKSGVRDPAITPQFIFLDPEATVETPDRLWRTTGIRTLDHIIETMISNFNSEPARIMALKGLEKILHNLPDGSVSSRYECQLAAWYSYFEVYDSPFGLSHSIGRIIGAKWEIPHGVTSCITLPSVLRHYARTAPEPLAFMGNYLGLSTTNIKDLAMGFAKLVENFIDNLGLSSTLGQYGISESDFPYIAGKMNAKPGLVEKLLKEML